MLLRVVPAKNVQKLLQCLGFGSRCSGGGFLAAGFGIILGCWYLGVGGGAWVGAHLAVWPAVGQGGVSAATVPTGRVSPATAFLHGWLWAEKRQM